MKLSKEGVWFTHYGDELLWYWPWKKSGNTYYSPLTKSTYDNLREYWFQKGQLEEAARKEKIIGYSEDQMFMNWAEFTFKYQIALILRNVNVEQKPYTFWKSIPASRIKELSADYPVLLFGDLYKALEVAKSIPIDFAETFLFYHGNLHYTNYTQHEDYNKRE